jgi:hypothetical protein
MPPINPSTAAALTAAVAPVLKQFQVTSAIITIAGSDPLTVAAPIPVLVQPVLTTIASELSFDPNASGRVLENAVLTSPDGKGFGGNVRGKNVSIINVSFKDLSDGLHADGCTNLIIKGGAQVGNVTGRCWFFLNVNGLNWYGDSSKVFGHATQQSPVRFSSPGVVNGIVQDVHVTQAGSPFPIACWAIHAAVNVHFLNCVSDSGEFSFDSAGEGVGDKVTDCLVENLTVINSKLYIGPVALRNTIKAGKFTNPSGEAISVQCTPGSGNVIDGAEIHSDSAHAIHFYAASDLLVKNCTFYRTNPAAVLMDGACTAANDGGGNKIVDVK